MALIDGQTLAERVKQGPLAPEDAARLVHKIAQALAAVHAAGVIHRDIKPSNVMLDRSGEPLLMDFGLARQHEGEQLPSTREAALAGGDAPPQHLPSTSILAGTLPYMSPQQIEGRPADARSDVYSLAVVLYELLTGRLPFAPGDSVTQLLANIARSEASKPRTLCPGVDRTLESICLRGMARDPAERYQSAAEMAEALGRYLQGKRQAPRPRRRWPAWIVAACAAAAVLLAGTVIYVKTNKGILEVVLGVSDATVTIDGTEVKVQTPSDEISLRVGEHELQVSKDGFMSETKPFVIRRGGKTEVKVERLARWVPVVWQTKLDTEGAV